MRCHTDGGVFIPGCMGGAVYGKRGCTCTRDAVERKRDELADAIRELARAIKVAERLLARLSEGKR